MQQARIEAELSALARQVFPVAEKKAAVPVCRVRAVTAEGEEKLAISFFFNGIERVLVRKQGDSLESTFARMRKTLAGKQAKDCAGAAGEPWLADPNGAPISFHQTNGSAWQTDRVLHIGDASWEVSKNEPSVTTLQVKQPLIERFGVQPAITKEHCDTVVFRWSRKEADGKWEVVAEGPESYTPQGEDVGRQLKVEAVAIRNQQDKQMVGSVAVCEIDGAVQQAPDLSVYSDRITHLAKFNAAAAAAANRIRIVSLNLLADNTPAARNGRYAFCAPEALDIHYRKQILTWELLQYDADVMCLQEVTPAAFDSYIAPQLASAGWAALRVDKNFTTSMSCAVLYKTSKFDLAAQHRVDLYREWRGLSADEFPTVAADQPEWLRSPFLGVNFPGQLSNNLDGNSAIAQIVALTPKPPAFSEGAGPVFVVNTHTMGHPKEEVGRVVQCATIVRKLRAVLYEHFRLTDAAVVFGGDLNSMPQEACHDMMASGRIDKSHSAWTRARRLFAAESSEIEGHSAHVRARWDAEGPANQDWCQQCGEEDGVDVDLGWRFERGATEVQKSYIDPKDFEAESYREECVVDFIYFNHHLRSADGWAPVPQFPEAILRAHTAIPSAQFGSDHVALLHELQLVGAA